MKIQSIQPNQQSFGTKVRMDVHTAKILSLSRTKDKILREIEQLENNGINDILSISRTYKEDSFISATVLKEDNGRVFVSFPATEPVECFHKGECRFISIKDLYKNAKMTLNEVIINKPNFKQFIPFVG